VLEEASRANFDRSTTAGARKARLSSGSGWRAPLPCGALGSMAWLAVRLCAVSQAALRHSNLPSCRRCDRAGPSAKCYRLDV
jgi:hypothetical protein